MGAQSVQLGSVQTEIPDASQNFESAKGDLKTEQTIFAERQDEKIGEVDLHASGTPTLQKKSFRKESTNEGDQPGHDVFESRRSRSLEPRMFRPNDVDTSHDPNLNFNSVRSATIPFNVASGVRRCRSVSDGDGKGELGNAAHAGRCAPRHSDFTGDSKRRIRLQIEHEGRLPRPLTSPSGPVSHRPSCKPEV